jgi:hypothetical protein
MNPLPNRFDAAWIDDQAVFGDERELPAASYFVILYAS